MDVFKLYYTYLTFDGNTEEISNIYKLYFILNIYGYYTKTELLTSLIEILKSNEFSDDLITIIKTSLTDIYNEVLKIYEGYLMTFNETDKIIKNLYNSQEKIHKYLNMNFIYEFYKNYKKEDIDLIIDIKGNSIQIRKSLNEISKDIDEIFKNGQSLFHIPPMRISFNDVYNDEIDYFTNFIYHFTKNSFEIDNINDFFCFIVFQLLSNDVEEISMKINGTEFKLKNIKNHPYKFLTETYDFSRIDIKLNDIQMNLVRQLLENPISLLGILGREFYYLDFNIHKSSIFKFHLNYDLMSLNNTEDNFKKTIINYPAYSSKPMDINQLTNITILSLENVRLIFLINYAILLSSSLFSQLTINNYISLIYIYFLIKTNTKEYLNLFNYKKDNPVIIIYRDFLKSFNFLEFLKTILILMRKRMNLRMDLNGFTRKIINFKENEVINNIRTTSKVNIDIRFIQQLFEITSIEVGKDFKENLFKCFMIFYKFCINDKKTGKLFTNEIIQLNYIFVIPVLRELIRLKMDFKKIEKDVLDLKALELTREFEGKLIKGGDKDDDIFNSSKKFEFNKGDKREAERKEVERREAERKEAERREAERKKPEANIKNIEEAKEILKKEANKKNNIEEGEFISTTNLSDDSKKILEALQVFNKFYTDFDKLNLEEMEKTMIEVFENYFVIYDIDTIADYKSIIEDKYKSDTTPFETKIYINSSDQTPLYPDFRNSGIDSTLFSRVILPVINNVLDNLRNLELQTVSFDYNPKIEKDSREADLSKMNQHARDLYRVLKGIDEMNKKIADLAKFKNKSIEIRHLFDEFSPEDDEKVPLMLRINEYVNIFKKSIDDFQRIIKDAIEKYKNIQKSLEKYKEEGDKYYKDVAQKKATDEEAKKKIKEQENDRKIKNINDDIDKLNQKKNLKEEQLESEKNILETLTNEKEKKETQNKIEKFKLEIQDIEIEMSNKDKEKTRIIKEIQKRGGSNKGDIKQIKTFDTRIQRLFEAKVIPDKNDEKISAEQRKNDIKKRFDNIKKDYKKLKVSTYIPKSVDKDLIIDKFIDKNGDTLFERMLNEYNIDAKLANVEYAKAKFYEGVESNNLDPEKELEIIFTDKLIFAFLIIFLRYAGLYITYRFIDNNVVKSIKEAIIYYSLSYVAVLFIFVFIVNIDLFRLRIIFNYCNLHINSTGILSHMAIKIIIGYIVYLLIINLDNQPLSTMLSKNQKIKLKKKLDILTIIVLLFLIIFVLII